MLITKNKKGFEFQWPEIFETKDISGRSDALLCADGLVAWGNCHAGAEIVPSFGEVMAKIASKLDVLCTDDSLMEKAKEYQEREG